MTESAASKVKPGAWLTGRSTYKRPLSYSGVSVADPRVARAVDLVSYEAELLDRKNYEEWQELYSEDGIYVIPIDPETEDFAGSLNMVFDDDAMRRSRVVRLTEGYAIAAVDAATTVRTLGRFICGEVDDDGVLLRAAQVIVAYKRGTHHLWAGDVEYRVRFGATPADDRIALKVIRLIDSQDSTPAAGFLL
ncbi:hypothetical protein JD276_13395 [Leucobacter sp. CSA1]|uniref:3-phenylpropionate/cinnamic acid dioxygenase small subunit n=1 Tax=Leucobacter chromiisoli TaxID=2796471 RepID=A0A934Q8X2_9MICO|nr:aromatic-ring-hydroxylating dioxygenase subunit beta [Leucobacter chromiisoli]MBK0420026.1 hypothetical protein [Leucobacter chromiisoli]